MLTLDRIRKTQQEKAAAEKKRKDNYKSPSGFTMLSRFMKEKNLEILNEFCDNENKSSLQREIIIEKYHKLNYYIPSVSYQMKNETNQFQTNDAEGKSRTNYNSNSEDNDENTQDSDFSENALSESESESDSTSK